MLRGLQRTLPKDGPAKGALDTAASDLESRNAETASSLATLRDLSAGVSGTASSVGGAARPTQAESARRRPTQATSPCRIAMSSAATRDMARQAQAARDPAQAIRSLAQARKPDAARQWAERGFKRPMKQASAQTDALRKRHIAATPPQALHNGVRITGQAARSPQAHEPDAARQKAIGAEMRSHSDNGKKPTHVPTRTGSEVVLKTRKMRPDCRNRDFSTARTPSRSPLPVAEPRKNRKRPGHIAPIDSRWQ